MPWAPELFSAPVLQGVLDKYRRGRMRSVPFFDGLLSGEVDALVESFSGVPEVHHPARGRIRGERAFRRFVTDMTSWLAAGNAEVEHVNWLITDPRGVEEVVVHLDGDRGRIGLPVALTADHDEDERIVELRLYFSSWPLTGRHTNRPPLLQPDLDLHEPDVVGEYQRALATATSRRSSPRSSRTATCASRPATPTSTGGPTSCARSTSGSSPMAAASRWSTAPSPTTAAPARWSTTWSRGAGRALPPEAGLAVYVRGDSGRLAAARVYDDSDPPLSAHRR